MRGWIKRFQRRRMLVCGLETDWSCDILVKYVAAFALIQGVCLRLK